MKHFYLLVFLFSLGIVSAQEKLSKEEKERREKNIQAANPFAKYGYKAKVATLSKGKYLEVHDLDSIVTIGTVRFHVDKEQIVGNVLIDSLNPDAQPIGDVTGRWISMDPLSEEFPSWSPYNFVLGNPLRFNDPTGMAPEDVTPYLVRKLQQPSLDPIYQKGVLTKELGATMRNIMKTETGRGYISQFMKKDDVFYGYKASSEGKYSDVMLNIVQYSLDKDNQHLEGVSGFADHDGTVVLSESESGKLMVNIYTNQTDIEAISHELFVHNAGEMDGIISAYRKGGIEAAQKANIYSEKDDHKALKTLDPNHKGIKMYMQLSKELQNLDSKYKKQYDEIKKTNDSRYNDLK